MIYKKLFIDLTPEQLLDKYSVFNLRFYYNYVFFYNFYITKEYTYLYNILKK